MNIEEGKWRWERIFSKTPQSTSSFYRISRLLVLKLCQYRIKCRFLCGVTPWIQCLLLIDQKGLLYCTNAIRKEKIAFAIYYCHPFFHILLRPISFAGHLGEFHHVGFHLQDIFENSITSDFSCNRSFRIPTCCFS